MLFPYFIYFSENGIAVMNLVFKSHEIPEESKVSCSLYIYIYISAAQLQL